VGLVKQLETTIGGLFKDLPALPASAKESLVKIWPWLALVFGLLQAFAAYALWQLTRVVDRFSNLANEISLYYTGETVGLSAFDKSVIYIGILVLLVDAVILLMAFPELQKRTRRGWDLLFLGSLINLGYAIVSIFIDGRGMGTFISSLIGSAIGFYLLFQIRDHYKAKKA
jgi:hypothetical protein